MKLLLLLQEGMLHGYIAKGRSYCKFYAECLANQTSSDMHVIKSFHRYSIL